jgi:hypothetical protein
VAAWAASGRGVDIVAGRSTRSLDRMNIPRWLAWAIIAAWSAQLTNLWPLPDDTIAQMAATLVASTESVPPSALDGLKASLWLSWILWLVIVPIGIAAGAMALGKRRRWFPVFLVASVAYLAILCPWGFAMTVHGGSFQSLSRFIDHASWVVLRPSLVFGTVVFPLFIIVLSIYLVSVRLRARRHAV